MTSGTHGGWWTDLFSGAMLAAQRRMYSAADSAAHAAYVEKALELQPGSTVLDAPCGNGRVSLELAARGHRVTGLDLTAELIEEAREAARSRELGAVFETGDMQEIPWRDAFDGVCCIGNSFAYFDDAGNEAFLEGVARALRPGGRFVLETGVTAESIFPNLDTRVWYDLGDLHFLAARRHDPRSGRLHATYSVLQDGKLETKEASYRIYTVKELTTLVEKAGLEVLETSSGHEGEPFELGSRVLYVRARRK